MIAAPEHRRHQRLVARRVDERDCPDRLALGAVGTLFLYCVSLGLVQVRALPERRVGVAETDGDTAFHLL
jgi:hypothetical protein